MIKAKIPNKMKPLFFLFIIAFALLTTEAGADDYFKSFQCGQDITETDGLIPDGNFDILDEIKTYKKNDDGINIGDIDSGYISYLFLRNRFYGISVSIIGNNSINRILRHFQDEYGTPFRLRKKGRIIWLTDEQVIGVERFTHHLAQVGVFCRKQYEQRLGESGFLFIKEKE